EYEIVRAYPISVDSVFDVIGSMCREAGADRLWRPETTFSQVFASKRPREMLDPSHVRLSANAADEIRDGRTRA
ncbi:MAG TPA: hypothetical protein VM925_22535, partial [Labilithrix sp.]|nr:hypothetical protein [Labilithrix sp.]